MTDLPLSADETATWADLTRRVLAMWIASALALLPTPAIAQITPAQANDAASVASAYLTQVGNPLWACDPTQPDGLNPTYYDAQNPDVVAARLDARDHYNRYGAKEGRKPCQAQPANAVTKDQASAALTSVTAYLAQPQVATVSAYARDPNRADGFNPIWYNHANPDIAAAGVDPLQHFINAGLWEGRLPYEGAPPFVDEQFYWSKAPAPDVVIRDVYAAPGATSVTDVVCLQRHGAPAERSYTGGIYTVNSEGGYNTNGVQPLEGNQLFLPNTGNCRTFTIPLANHFDKGWFNAAFQTIDNPIASATGRVYVNTPPPAGYTPLAAAPAAAPLVEPTALAWDFHTDFLGSLSDLTKQGFRVGSTYGGGVNGMDGAWITASTRTVSGATPNPYPVELIDGKPTRVLRPVDQRNDQVIDPSGVRRNWAMGGLLLPDGVGPGVITFTFAIFGPHSGIDWAWWGIRVGNWPPEQDNMEIQGNGGASLNIHDFQALAKQNTIYPEVRDGKFHRITIERTLDFRLHAWLDGALVVDTPDYLRGATMDNFFSQEGIGGAGGAFDPAFDYPHQSGFGLREFAYKRY